MVLTTRYHRSLDFATLSKTMVTWSSGCNSRWVRSDVNDRVVYHRATGVLVSGPLSLCSPRDWWFHSMQYSRVCSAQTISVRTLVDRVGEGGNIAHFKYRKGGLLEGFPDNCGAGEIELMWVIDAVINQRSSLSHLSFLLFRVGCAVLSYLVIFVYIIPVSTKSVLKFIFGHANIVFRAIFARDTIYYFWLLKRLDGVFYVF